MAVYFIDGISNFKGIVVNGKHIISNAVMKENKVTVTITDPEHIKAFEKQYPEAIKILNRFEDK